MNHHLNPQKYWHFLNQGQKYFLDMYPGASAAYSTKKLRSSYTGPCMRVRRDADNTEQDIYFNGLNLDTDSLNNFVKGTNASLPGTYTPEAAYSVCRKIVDTYTGPLVRVRRSHDDTQLDIPQDLNGNLDQTALTNFCALSKNRLGNSSLLGLTSYPDTDPTKNFATSGGMVGLTYTVLGTGTISGRSYVDVQISGTSTAAGDFYLTPVYNTAYLPKAKTGEQWTHSVYFTLLAGTTPPGLSLFIAELDSSFTYLNGLITGTTATASEVRRSHSQTLASATVAYVTPQVIIRASGSGVAYNCTLRISGWQLEKGASATTFSETTGVPGGDCYVITWYDQSGNSNNLGQSITTAQPTIISDGTLITSGSKPSMNFNGTTAYLKGEITGFKNFTNLSSFFVMQPASATIADGATSLSWWFGADAAARYLSPFASGTGSFVGEKTIVVFSNSSSVSHGRLGSSSYTRTADYQFLTSAFNLSSGTSVFSNSQQITYELSSSMTTSTPTAPFNTNYTVSDEVIINGIFSSPNYNVSPAAKWQELIFYSANQTSNRFNIESNINNYYNLFTRNGFVKTWYDQSGNGYNMVQTTAAAQPKIIDANNLVTTNSIASISFDGTDDYMTASIVGFQSYSNLSSFVIAQPIAAAAADTQTFLPWFFGDFTVSRYTTPFGSATSSLTGEKHTILFSNNSPINGGRLGSTTYNRNSNQQILLSGFNLTTGTSIFQNNSSITLDLASLMTASTPSAPVNTGYTTSNNVFLNTQFTSPSTYTISPAAKFQTLLFYSSDQTSNRVNIETFLNSLYNIF